MSRSGYSDDLHEWARICWRGAVASGLRGKRGQAFLREMLAALDAMPEKKLIASELVTETGCCAIGTVAVARGLDVSDLEPEDNNEIAKRFGISRAMVCEIEYINDDEDGWRLSSRSEVERFDRVRQWVVENIKEATP